MDARPDVLAETVRAKRVAVDNDLELLRVRLRKADPRRIDGRRWATTILPVVGGVAAAWLWARRRRSMDTLEDLLITGLNDLWLVEQQLGPALERMRAGATNPELQQAFDTHRRETDGHVDRLLRVFRSVGAKPRARGTSKAVAGMILEGERLLKGGRIDPDVRDAGLIAVAQRIEHYEIASYGTLRTHAATLGFVPAADLLQQTLDEEKAVDEKLTALAERFVNPQSIRGSRSV